MSAASIPPLVVTARTLCSIESQDCKGGVTTDGRIMSDVTSGSNRHCVLDVRCKSQSQKWLQPR